MQCSIHSEIFYVSNFSCCKNKRLKILKTIFWAKLFEVYFIIRLLKILVDVNYLEKKQQSNNSVIAQKDIHIKKLESQILSLEQSEQELSEESNKQHEEIIALKREINALEDSISMRMVELDNKNQSIKILERQLLEVKEKVSFIFDYILKLMEGHN